MLIFFELSCIATIELSLCHSLVLYNFIEQKIQHPAEAVWI